MLIEHDGRRPDVGPTAWVAPTAVLSGEVRVGPACRVLGRHRDDRVLRED